VPPKGVPLTPEHRAKITAAMAKYRKLVHGTISAYNNKGCRCPRCKAAWSAYMKKRRVPRRADR
jgi:7-cyano-7-deazaguanine synthase in queuosine biosynthesis